MAVKNIKYSGSQLVDEGGETTGFQVNDEYGLYNFYSVYSVLVSDMNKAFHKHIHRVTETRNPIWNQVTYDVYRYPNYINDTYNGVVTLNGLKDDGTTTPLMQHLFSGPNEYSGRKVFDLSGSSCTNSMIQQTKNGSSGGAGTIEVEVPLQSKNYQDADIEAAWGYEGWDYRMALQIVKSTGKFRNAKGHKSTEWYGINIAVPYMANMADGNFTDIRFTAADGITELPFYVIKYTASTSAAVIVMIPWWFLDKDREAFESASSTSGTLYAHSEPSYIYCYYGNPYTTSASDITLDDNTYFYDTFDDNTLDTTKWPTVSNTAHGFTTEAGGNLKIDLTGGYTESPSVQSQAISDITMGTTPFTMIWEIVQITPASHGTSTTDMPIFRCYVDASNFTQCYFPYTGTPWGGGTAGVYWRYGSTTGGTSNTPYSTYKWNGTTTSTRFLRLQHIPSSDTTTGGKNVWSVSSDAIKWDFIGYNPISEGPITGSPSMRMIYQGSSAVADAKSLYINSVITYPTVSNELEYFEDEFTNGINETPNDRWIINAPAGCSITEASVAGSASSGIPGNIRMAITTTGTHYWNGTEWTCPTMYTASKANISDNVPNNEVSVYQTYIGTMGTPYTRSIGGIALFNGTTASTMYALRFGISKTSAGAYTFEVQRQAAGTVTDIYAAGVTTAPMPCHLRIVIDPQIKRIFFDYSEDGREWKRFGASNLTWNTTAYHNGPYMGLFLRSVDAHSATADFSYFKSMSGMREACDVLTWSAEDARSNYPIEVTVPDGEDMVLSFNTPANMIRNNATYIRTQMYGGAMNKSKMMFLSDADLIEIGPEGTDKYIGMELNFDFEFDEWDLFQVKAINYLYEVV